MTQIDPHTEQCKIGGGNESVWRRLAAITQMINAVDRGQDPAFPDTTSNQDGRNYGQYNTTDNRAATQMNNPLR